MDKRIFAIFLMSAVTLLPHSCSVDEVQRRIAEGSGEGGRNVSELSCYEPDRLRIKVSEDLACGLEEMADSSGRICVAGLKSVEGALASCGVVEMKRTFPYAGKFEARTRAEGLHLWYDALVRDCPEDGLTRALESLSGIGGVDVVEFRPKAVLMDGTSFFDDPELPLRQWHLYNDGSTAGSIAGCDINVVPAWEEFTKGTDEVIVAVVDGGIDWAHEDLAANMWHNPKQTGDNVYGYNFVTDSYLINAHDHGTHVAGLVGAVNNNGIGVSGVAGGDFAAGIPGVRLMSCQIFDGDNSTTGAEAIKWAADHGAVIAQNSWGYEKSTGVTVTPLSERQAIDYFVKYAGYDENGNQVGPMAGGLVVFAAGNDTYDINCPSSYAPCLAVAALGADYGAAWYTNYGDWVDVSAPGGDERDGNTIYSTLPGNRYGTMQGTSQACPQVSGIAALVVSYYGGPGFTADMLREKIESGVKDISMYNSPLRPLGRGLVDAYQILMPEEGEAPERIEDFHADIIGKTVTVSCTLPRDPDDAALNMLLVYYGKEEMSSVYPFRISEMMPGDVFAGSFELPEYGTVYRMAAAATDRAGNVAPLSDEVSVNVVENNPPVIEPVDGTSMTLHSHEAGMLYFYITDPEGHSMTASFEPVPEDGVMRVVEVTEDTVALRVDGPRMKPGYYSLNFTVTDDYGAFSSLPVNIRVLENNPPEVRDDVLPGVVFGSKMESSATFPWYDFFEDLDGEVPAISLIVENESVAAASVNTFGNIVITPMSYGQTWVNMTASDISGMSASYRLCVVVRDGTRAADLYPNPVVDTLSIRAGVESASGTVRITGVSGSVVYEAVDVSLSAFSPLKVDMSGIPGGVYTVTVKYGEKTVKENVAKL